MISEVTLDHQKMVNFQFKYNPQCRLSMMNRALSMMNRAMQYNLFKLTFELSVNVPHNK